MTMTYEYSDSVAVLGPLAIAAEPGGYDLCLQHAERTSAPQGWEVIRLPVDTTPAPMPPEDDLMALADAVRAIGLRHDDVDVSPAPPVPPHPAEPDKPVIRRGHLRLV